ncbi:HWE histidine kinase domain-containing protein [Pleomorphomonas oryzae]|uniref:HWE histidine kinase domain-containing protein n=1 Tax=Pleomorphomonas oryzae TaxID=261934 RepID=UPI00047CB38A|nr:HWE histidine kinase domain-containing protein [Pleomorphomonas oryzae]
MNTEDLYRLLRTGHIQAQGIVDTIADPLLLLDENLCVLNASRAFFRVFQVDRYETIGKPLYELGNGQWDIAELRHLLLKVIPRSTALIDYKVEHEFPDLGRKTMLLTARTLHHPDNGSHSMLVSLVDITERDQRDAIQDMLFGELKHRMSNLLSVSLAIARKTTTKDRTAEQYRDDFLGRFSALVEAQEVGFAGNDTTDLKVLIERIVAPYLGTPEAVVVEAAGAVILGASTLMALGLVLHELATNAARYGALSVPDGKVSIGWLLDDESKHLRLWWVESHGPPVTPPAVTGYGCKLIHTAIALGEVKQHYAPTGLETKIAIPLGPASAPV